MGEHVLAKYICASVFYHTPVGLIGDTKIIASNARAPALFGFDTVDEFVGQHMSDLQSPEWREAGHQRYLDRKLGRRVSKRYAVVVRHPDGAEVGQTREFRGFYAGEDGREMYGVIVRPTREVDHCPVRELEESEQRLANQINGDLTMAEARMLLNSVSDLDGLETFQHIISQCDVLSSGVFAGKYQHPLDLYVSNDVTVAWEHFGEKAQAAPMVRPRFRCDRCGWAWYGRTARRGQCTYPGCKKSYAW